MVEHLIVNDGIVVYNDFKDSSISKQKVTIGKHNPKLVFRLRLLPTSSDEKLNITHNTNIPDLIDQHINVVII